MMSSTFVYPRMCHTCDTMTRQLGVTVGHKTLTLFLGTSLVQNSYYYITSKI